MEILKNIVIVIYILICLALIIVATMQTKDASGTTETITGSSTNNFLDKNKGRTTQGKLKKLTVILGVAFVVSTVVLGILYVI